MRYSLNISTNYILNKAVNDKDTSRMSGWNKDYAIKWKNNAFFKEYFRSEDTLFDSITYLKVNIIANLLFSSICIL